MIVVVCPGQGSQTPGFLSPWLELPAFKASMDEMQAASGIDLIGYGTTADADTIRDTAVAQPLIVSAGAAAFAAMLSGQSASEAGIAGVAGHSVGEITAAVVSGVMSADQGIKFVKTRGDAMAAAAALEVTSMAAVLGGDQAAVEARLAELGLEPANYNGGGQIVAAGSADGIAALQAEPVAGTRVIPLQVAGAFHTRYMAPAVTELRTYSETLTVQDPAVSLWSNNGGLKVSSGSEFLSLMVNQVSSPVRWDLCMASMIEAGVTAMIELAPAGTLVGLAKRSMPGIETLAVKTPDNIDAALSLINNHR
ncbi:ACP S-malonyltransferase [Rhodoluna sp.]|uniref:ACP S-malonyltransferase n=1 Tax=Rhodoluna sp. TaxID=1969481 RepID=UPI0025EC35AC|nr:ACP S-malonyltransferase [Rhodoluna sp.]